YSAHHVNHSTAQAAGDIVSGVAAANRSVALCAVVDEGGWALGLYRHHVHGAVTKLRLKPPSQTEPRRGERIFVTRRPFGPQLRQLLKPKTCLNRTDIGFRRCRAADTLPLEMLIGRARVVELTTRRGFAAGDFAPHD